jgi:hypothetical protein
LHETISDTPGGRLNDCGIALRTILEPTDVRDLRGSVEAKLKFNIAL